MSVVLLEKSCEKRLHLATIAASIRLSSRIAARTKAANKILIRAIRAHHLLRGGESLN